LLNCFISNIKNGLIVIYEELELKLSEIELCMCISGSTVARLVVMILSWVLSRFNKGN